MRSVYKGILVGKGAMEGWHWGLGWEGTFSRAEVPGETMMEEARSGWSVEEGTRESVSSPGVRCHWEDEVRWSDWELGC